MTVAGAIAAAETEPLTSVWNRELSERAAPFFQQLPPPTKHYSGGSEAEVTLNLQSDAHYQELVREKLKGGWFAALVAAPPREPYSIHARFKSWHELVEWLAEKNALVEVWVRGGVEGKESRRIPLIELAELKRQRHEPPTFITVTYPEEVTGKAVSYQLEFGFRAAEVVRASDLAYQRHRLLQLRARAILAARNPQGRSDALAQWAALQNEIHDHQFPLLEMPPLPTNSKDIFVAFEFEVDEANNFSRATRVYLESEVQKAVVADSQILLLRRSAQPSGQEVVGFGRRNLSEQPQPVLQPILGEDFVELRVKDAAQPDPQRWHVLEFGEPELIKQSALAHFAQLNAYLERNRKANAMKQANLALVAEPIIAGLNIGGGLAGLGFPAGESARLLYNLITFRLISNVPTTRTMRELFALMAARDRHLEIKIKPERFLSQQDIQTLKDAGRKLSDEELQAYLERMSDEDVAAMLRLARQGMFDAKVTTFLNILASTFKVSGLSENPGVIRDIFNNVRFSVNGEINISTLLLLALGKSEMTALSGTSLETLSHGEGPQEAWLQYLVISVDIRAVLNTLVRLIKPTEAKKELEKPFPYAPRMSELAAYEIRIFGFPLLMYYKRGLIQADREAYEHDYAYGLYGVRLVERFHTREEMEAEIRAGRMFPLGLVKVPTAGGWKETDLVVYAHRITGGKFHGKTALIIYGLKAYVEYSELIGRELIRFKEFERGLREGAVIEQRIWQAGAPPSPAWSYEPVLHVGSNAVQQVFAPLLGNLLELRRNSLRQSWDLPVAEADREEVKRSFEALGIQPDMPDALVDVDQYNSSFMYRRRIGDEIHLIKIVNIPSLEDIEREVQKAEEDKVIEEIRAEAAAGKSAGAVLLNEAVPVHGRFELGPLLRNAQGEVVGRGVTSGTNAIELALGIVSALPVADQARLRANHFAATAVELERGDKEKEMVFLTIEFPLGEVRRESSNRLTGETETVVYTNGVWAKTITDRRIVEPEYDSEQMEIACRTFANLGKRQEPRHGALLEETRTLDYWPSAWTQPGLDPYQPTIAKLHINYVTGQLTRETYGLFELPIESASEQYLTRSRYTPYGLPESASIFENGREESDFQRPAPVKLLQPVAGRPRFQLTAQVSDNAAVPGLPVARLRTVVERTNLVKGLVTKEIFDNAHFGRKIQETYVDPFDGTRSFSSVVNWEYKDDFHFGLVPVRAVTSSSPAGARMAEVTTTSYDPVGQRLAGREVSYTGKIQTNIWDFRWSQPVEVVSAQRKVTQEFNRDETVVHTTVSALAAEVIEESTGQYDPRSKTWLLTRQFWYQPGVPTRSETNVYSALGRLLSSRTGNLLETRPTYTPEGIEQASATFLRNDASGRYDILYRQQDQLRWENGRRDARVQIYLDGSLADEYRSLTDEAGRTIEDGVRTWPELALKTIFTYEGGTERVLKIEQLQNGQVRTTHRTLGASRLAEGSWLLKVEVVPFWGLVFTNSYLLGEPRGRLVATEFENGSRGKVTDWFADTAVARSTELNDRHGHARERFVKQVNAGSTAGVPYDLVRHYKLSPWGEPGLTEELALVRGSDLPLFSEQRGERTYFDLSKPYQCPQYRIDPSGHFGCQVSIRGTMAPNVTTVFACQFRNWREPGDANRPAERVLEISGVELQGFFSYPFSTRVFDRAGNLLEESSGQLALRGARTISDESLLAEMSRTGPNRKSAYRYQAGCFEETVENQTGQTMVAFAVRSATNIAGWNVNDARWREWPTEVNSYRNVAQSDVLTNGTPVYHCQRLFSPRWLKQNRYLPGVTNVWMAWTRSELDDSGNKRFDSEAIFNAEGEPSVVVAHKLNSQGRPATKLAYHLPRPVDSTWQAVPSAPGTNTLRLNLGGQEDLSLCDFLGVYVDAPATAGITMQFLDSSQHTVLVGSDSNLNDRGLLSFWPMDSAQAQWLPYESLPERGSIVAASRSLVQEGKVFVVSVPELARAGLDVGHVSSIQIIVAKLVASQVRITPLYRLQHDERLIMPPAVPSFYYSIQGHSSGLTVYKRANAPFKAQPSGLGQGWNSTVAYDGGLVATLHPRFDPPYYPVFLPTDGSEPERPQPLYALAAEDGRFIEYYQSFCTGDSQVYTVVSGFDTPRMELIRARILDDELSPGILAFGRDYYVTVPLAKAAGTLPGALASLHNRCVASAFALGGNRFLRFIFGNSSGSAQLEQVTREHGPATAQTRHVNELPTLAEALLPTRQVPWANAATALPEAPMPQTRKNALRALYQLRGTYLGDTGLVPTSSGTAVARYVDTVAEGGIIELAVKLGEPTMAREILDFYYQQSNGGTIPLHTSYDARTGASLAKITKYKRAVDSDITAQAQLAIAQAAFCLGTATGDINALKFGSNLVQSVLVGSPLAGFRSDSGEALGSRGIWERPLKKETLPSSIKLWPAPKTFSLASNARAYLLFSRLEELADRYPFGPKWKQEIRNAAREQASWLTQQIAPYVQAAGAVPKGLFEIQDVINGQGASAIERWTATDDWLVFIEAADHIGISRDLTRAWLDNLARTHGVIIGDEWGLDWTIPLERPDAISLELTARFLRIAKLLGHTRAAEFAQQNLSHLQRDGTWPVTITTASTNSPLETGLGFAIYPAIDAPPQAQRRAIAPVAWPPTMGVYHEMADVSWPFNLRSGVGLELHRAEARDVTQFLWTATAFYVALILVTLFWWGLHYARRRGRAASTAVASSGLLVPEAVMQIAEERWAKRVLGLRIPSGSEHSRYSNGAVEQNFHQQLRALYKLVLEWRRVVNDWSASDSRICEDGSDEWLNGMDEFAVMVGIYTRWVIKAGRKDGLPRPNVLQENEDSNHIWSRLALYFSESHLRLLSLLKEFKANPAAAAVLGLNEEIELVLRMLGVRARAAPFDARMAFEVPTNPSAMDLLLIQHPGTTLAQIAAEMESKLGIPAKHVARFIKGYKSFKEREQILPIHPYLLEAAKMLPHFLLMGLVALIWYNNQLGGLRLYPYLKELAIQKVLDPRSLIWAVPLSVGFALSVTARYLQIYRYRWGAQSPTAAAMTLDADLTTFFGGGRQMATPALRVGPWWNPLRYQRAGWVFRALGLALLAASLFRLEVPGFATFMCVKGLLGMLLLVESAGLLGPLLTSRFSAWLENHVTSSPKTSRLTRFVNQLNLVPTRPASLLWLSVQYHFQPSFPTGGLGAILRTMAFYLLLSSTFFFVGGYMFKQALEIWFHQTYLADRDLGLILGSFLFWNTMYLLRFGLFVLLAGICSFAAIYPFKVATGFVCCLCLALQSVSEPFHQYLEQHLLTVVVLTFLGLLLSTFELELLCWLRNWLSCWRDRNCEQPKQRTTPEPAQLEANPTLGVVYMSGDELSFHKLAPNLLMTRLRLLRDQLGSGGWRLLSEMHALPDDASLGQWFESLYALERKHDVTLWHPIQIVIAGEPPALRPTLGLNLTVAHADQRRQILSAWHIRRWLVTMMSTAGHSQDTAINLADIALFLAEEGLGSNTVFYLIQNKYDNQDNNRPSQRLYDQSELGHRNKLARLLTEIAPGCRAYNINDWTPFGFKAGGLVGMDLVYEESLKLTNMLLLDRNATAHDLEAVIADIKSALSDPGIVNIIPGRSTTNALTPIGQGSQLIEEGHRALTRGVMMLGGAGAESLGTGWGNLQAIYYGRIQQALCDVDTPKMPLTTAAQRSASFGDRFEGLIGFGPHAIGISEDIWGVTQAAHNALALGFRVQFLRSRTLWHKLRECWSHAEWLSAFPRWSGGYFQMMLDPLMQRINDFGPMSVFAKELRACGGRYFLGAPLALLSILLMPLAIICDVSPFVQILILLWNLSLVMNQVLTLLGLVAGLESSGFNRLTALAGFAAAGILGGVTKAITPTGVCLMAGGFLVGGFAAGLGRWFCYRGRDLVLFGPQVVIHTLGQVVRQSLEFVLSGALANDAKAVNIAFRAWVGPREDRPCERYQTIVNLRSVVWGVGLVSLLLNLFALANLDFLNVLLLLPSLMFSVSVLVGPFLMQPKPGKYKSHAAWMPKLLGWLAAFLFYMVVARFISLGGWLQWVGLFFGGAVFSCVLMVGLKYAGFATRLEKLTARLVRQMVEGGLQVGEAQQLAQVIVCNPGADANQTRVVLQKTPLSPEVQEVIRETLENQVLPFLKKPITDQQTEDSGRRRFVSLWNRSFVLGLFTFAWFFVVPVPGLLVFTAPGGYRASMSLVTVLGFGIAAVGAALAVTIVGWLVEQWQFFGLGQAGLVGRVKHHYTAFQLLAIESGRLSSVQISRFYAMFTDTQTFFDQRSFAYAQQTLQRIESAMNAIQKSEQPGESP